ncbi:MAG: hypothetical protein WCO56_27365 [Verrucomicrobiota bacterium]
MADPAQPAASDYVQRLISLLGLSEDEVLAALLSSFVPSNPGSVALSWAKRNNYTAPPSTKVLWDIMVAADFRCEECHTHHDLTFHHRNDDAHDSCPENLQLLCRNCNRAKSRRPVKQRDFKINIFKTYLDLFDRLGRPPTPVEIKRHLNLKQLSSSVYMVHFLNTRFAVPTAVRAYSPSKHSPHSTPSA